MFFKNNKSAISNSDFVDQAVKDLVDSGCAYEVPFTPYIVNPLSVATIKSGKKRSILDLSVLNKFVKKEKFKFEDWRLAIQFFHTDSYLFKFDLKNGYHHDILTCVLNNKLILGLIGEINIIVFLS